MFALSFGGWCLVCTVGYVLCIGLFVWGWARLRRGGRDED